MSHSVPSIPDMGKAEWQESYEFMVDMWSEFLATDMTIKQLHAFEVGSLAKNDIEREELLAFSFHAFCAAHDLTYPSAYKLERMARTNAYAAKHAS